MTKRRKCIRRGKFVWPREGKYSIFGGHCGHLFHFFLRRASRASPAESFPFFDVVVVVRSLISRLLISCCHCCCCDCCCYVDVRRTAQCEKGGLSSLALSSWKEEYERHVRVIRQMGRTTASWTKRWGGASLLDEGGLGSNGICEEILPLHNAIVTLLQQLCAVRSQGFGGIDTKSCSDVAVG